jgi:hypothetical protein
MSTDLRTILDGWEYEPGKISVRKVLGTDGDERIQTRVDLGILQFELEDRPDGTRPFGCSSLLEYCEERLQDHINREGNDEGFSISSDMCRDLRHETHQYYQRYLSYFVLEEFESVARDTEHNLRAIDLSHAYGESDYDRLALESQRGYVIMMNTRAKAYRALADQDPSAALVVIRNGIQELREVAECADDGPFDESVDATGEIRVLETLRDEVYEKMPANAASRLQRELQVAIQSEDYERAATIRDQLGSRLPKAVR